MEERDRVVDIPLELSTVQTLICVCMWTVLSTVEILSCRQHFTGGCVCQSLGLAVDKPKRFASEFASDPNSEFWFSFFLRLHVYVKRGYCLLLLYYVLD